MNANQKKNEYFVIWPVKMMNIIWPFICCCFFSFVLPIMHQLHWHYFLCDYSFVFYFLSNKQQQASVREKNAAYQINLLLIDIPLSLELIRIQRLFITSFIFSVRWFKRCVNNVWFLILIFFSLMMRVSKNSDFWTSGSFLNTTTGTNINTTVKCITVIEIFVVV